LELMSCSITSSEAILPTLPKMLLADLQKDFFAWSSEHLNLVDISLSQNRVEIDRTEIRIEKFIKLIYK